MTLAALPKIELHLHLEGAAPPEFMRRLATEKRVDLSGAFRPDGTYAFEGFRHFLEVYDAVTNVLRTPGDYARLTRAVLERSARDGVIYTEVFLCPEFCGGGDLAAWREYLAAIAEAAAQAEADLGIAMRGIATCIRHLGPERAKRAALCAAETADSFLVGFGMAGDERVGRQGDFAWAFDCAREAGLGLTTHAGEWAGPTSVAEALDRLRVDRIGHGVRAAEDPALVERLAGAGTVLEVCPGSNLALGLYPAAAAHPIAALRAAGVAVTVSTDDPPFFHTDMVAEYDALQDAFGWQEADFAGLNCTAADAAFCDAETRARLRARLG